MSTSYPFCYSGSNRITKTRTLGISRNFYPIHLSGLFGNAIYLFPLRKYCLHLVGIFWFFEMNDERVIPFKENPMTRGYFYLNDVVAVNRQFSKFDREGWQMLNEIWIVK